MRMPHPYNSHENKILAERHFGKDLTLISMFPEEQIFAPGEIQTINDFADKMAKDHEAMVNQALEKLAENHYQEYVRISHGENHSIGLFKKGLELQHVSLWADGSWAMVFQSEVGVLSNHQVCVSFPVNRPSFTSLIGN